MNLSGTHYELQENIATVQTEEDSVGKEEKSTRVNMHKLISICQESFETFLEEIPQIENMICEIDKAAISYKQQLTELQKSKITSSNTSTNEVLDTSLKLPKIPPEECRNEETSEKLKMEDDEINEKIKSKLPINHPLHKLEKKFFENISKEPILIQSDGVDSCGILRRYAISCYICIYFEGTKSNERGSDKLWNFKVYLKEAHKNHSWIVARDSHIDINILKESVCKNLILDLSKISKVILIKKFTELNCKQIIFIPTIDNIVKIEVNSEDNNKQSNDTDNTVNWAVKVDSDTINPTSRTCNVEAHTFNVEIDMIQENLNEIFNTFIKSDDLDDLIVMPEIGSRTQDDIKRLINKSYKPWLDGITFTYKDHNYLLIRKAFDMGKLVTILNSNGGQKGPYRLLQPGELNSYDFGGRLITLGKNYSLSGEQLQDNIAMVKAESNVDVQDADNNRTSKSSKCHFPDIIPKEQMESPIIDRIPSLESLSFLETYSIVIEDRLYNDHRAILMKFGRDHNISFEYSSSLITIENGDSSKWAACLTLRWLDQSLELTNGSGDSEHAAIDDASKNGLVILSGICNIIIRKTCRELTKHKRVRLHVRGGSRRSFNEDSRNENENCGRAWRNHGNMNRRRDIKRMKSVHNKSFLMLTQILQNYIVKNSSLDDLIFSPSISENVQEFIYGTAIGVMFKDFLKVINFTKSGVFYFSIMRIIAPAKLTLILMKCKDHERGPYKLYFPGTLDITFLWNRPHSYRPEGKIITNMDEYDKTIPTTQQLLNGPLQEPMEVSEKNKQMKRTFEDLMKNYGGGYQITKKRQKTRDIESGPRIDASQW